MNNWLAILKSKVAKVVLLEFRNQIFSARQNKNVGLPVIVVLWQSFFGLPRNRRHIEAPAKTENAVARAGIVGNRKFRMEFRAAGAYGNRDLG